MTPFGTLIRKNEEKNNIKRILNQDNMELEFLFNNVYGQLEKMTVISAERQLALENLRALTQQLQDKRLEYNSKEKSKYFTV